jgi:hypothetical protein
MNTIIDLESELLVDRSTIGDPYLRLMVAALGQPVIEGSAWAVVDKRQSGSAFSLYASQFSGAAMELMRVG